MKTRSGHLFKRNGVYYVQWRINGKLFMKSTKKTNWEKADEERAKIMAPFIVGDEIAVLESVASRIAGKKAELVTMENAQNPALRFEDAWQAYLDSPNRPDSGEQTLAQYEGHFRAFVKWLAETHKETETLQSVTPRIASEYASHLTKKGLSGNRFNKHIQFLQLMFTTLKRPARIVENPWADIKRKRLQGLSHRELTIEELRTVCQTAKGEERLLFALGVYTGLRLGDCATLRWSEVDLHRGIIRRIPNKTARRNPRPVLVPLHAALAAMLAKVGSEKRGDYVMPETAKLYMENPAELSRKIQKHFTTCKVRVHKPGTGPESCDKTKHGNPKRGTGKRAIVEVGFHSLRHSFVSMCREANAPLSVVESIVGHSSPAMTRHYTHTSEEAARVSVTALPMMFGDASKVSPPADPLAVLKTRIAKLVEVSSPETWEQTTKEVLALCKS